MLLGRTGGEEEGQEQGWASGAGPWSARSWQAPPGSSPTIHALSIPAQGLTLHLSSCNNVAGRDAGHVDQVDWTVSLNTKTCWEGESINPITLTSTNITLAKSTLALAPPPQGAGLMLECRTGSQSTSCREVGEARRSRQHPAPEPNGNVGNMLRAEPHIFYQLTKGYL